MSEPLSMGRYVPLVLVMCISSLLSLAASIAVVRIARFRLGAAYQRYLCIMSVVCILNSTFLILHPFLIPASTDYPWAYGNIQTCRMVGFFFHFGALMMSMYNAMLSIYFYCSIKTNPKIEKQPEDIVGWAETVANLSCWIIPAGLAAAAAGTQNINFDDGPDMCLMYPVDGTASPNIFGYIFAALICLSLLVSVGFTYTVHSTVRSTLKRGREYGTDAVLDDETKQRLEAVASQGVFYSMAFVNSILWPLVLAILPKDGNAIVYYIFQLLAYMMYPFQGVLNCSIYIRPRFQMLKVMYPDDSIIVLARVSLSMAGDPEEIEMVRSYIYGDDYECPSIDSDDMSANSSLPNEVMFDPNRPMSATSLVSCPGDESDHPLSDHGGDDDDDDDVEEGDNNEDTKIEIDSRALTGG